MSLQDDLHLHQLESKSDLKSKDIQISQLSEEINNCKDHMHKAFEICKATHVEEIKEIQSKLDQTEQEKRECLHDLKGTQRDLEKIEKGQVIELKKELIEMKKKMQEIMNKSSNRKDEVIKKSCKIVELMDDIREKDKVIDNINEKVKSLHEKEGEIKRELEQAAGVIKQLEIRITLSDKERAKESRLRKEEQERIIELIDEKHQQEINNTKKESWIDSLKKGDRRYEN